MLLTCVPYLIASLPGYAGPGLHFQGFLWGVDDANVYRSYIRQHATGHFFAFDQYSTEPQNPHFVNLLFLAMGLLCRLTGLSSVLIYHFFRVAGGVILLYLVYLFAAEVGLGRRGRWLAFLLASFSSGLGWVVYRGVTEGALSPPAGSRLAPIDVAAGWVAMPEAVTFLTVLTNALFVAGVALMLAVLLWGMRAAREPGWRATLICGALLFLLGNVHTYDVVVLYGVLGVLFLARALTGDLPWGRAGARYAVLALMGAPTVAWQYYVQSVDPIWAAKYLVPKTSPPLSGYLLGYGLLLFAALAGAVYAIRQRRAFAESEPGHPRFPSALTPVVWLALGFALVYAPVNFQRKLAEGLHIPLCLLAALALEYLLPLAREGEGAGGEAPRRPPVSSFRLVVALFLVVTVPSNLYYVADGLAHARVNNRDLAEVWYPPAYLTSDEVSALRWLGEQTTPGDTVLCSTYLGSYLPAYAPCRVVAGHWDETVHFGKYLRLVLGFYDPASSLQARHERLTQSRADLVVYGPEERLLQQLLTAGQPGGPRTASPVEGLPELREVYRQGEAAVYRVLPPSAPPMRPDPPAFRTWPYRW
jgi:hypothetical protein